MLWLAVVKRTNGYVIGYWVLVSSAYCSQATGNSFENCRERYLGLALNKACSAIIFSNRFVVGLNYTIFLSPTRA